MQTIKTLKQSPLTIIWDSLVVISPLAIHLGQDEMADMVQTTFTNAYVSPGFSELIYWIYDNLASDSLHND